MPRDTDVERLFAAHICSRPVSELAPVTVDSFWCESCEAHVPSHRVERRPIAERLSSNGAYILRPNSRELGELVERLGGLEDNPRVQDGRAHLHLRDSLGDRILDEASLPRWNMLRDARLQVVPFEIDSEHFSDLGRAIDLVYRAAERIVPDGFEPILVLVAYLGQLMPPPPTDPRRVLAWLGMGEGGVILLRPDGAPTLSTLEEHVRSVLALRSDA